MVLAQAAAPGRMSDAGPTVVPVSSAAPPENAAARNRELARNLAKGMGIEAELPEGKEAEGLPGLVLLSQYRFLTQRQRDETLNRLDAVFGRDNPAFMREVRGAAALAVTRGDLQPGLLSNEDLMRSQIAAKAWQTGLGTLGFSPLFESGVAASREIGTAALAGGGGAGVIASRIGKDIGSSILKSGSITGAVQALGNLAAEYNQRMLTTLTEEVTRRLADKRINIDTFFALGGTLS